MNGIGDRKKCLRCKYYDANICPLMAGADTFQIDKCILEYEEIKNIKEDSLDGFVFYSTPITYLSYLGYKEKENYPQAGQTVLTLTGGFGSRYPGKFIKVDFEDDSQIYLIDDDGKYCVSKDKWWEKLFKVG